MTRPARWATTSNLFALTIALLLFGTAIQREFGHYVRHDQDFYVYFFAAEVASDHPAGDIYYSTLDSNPQQRDAPHDSPIFQKAQASGIDEVMLYLYPPLAADIFIPLTRFSPHTAATLWQFFNFCLVFVSVFLLSRTFGIAIPSARFLVVLASVYAFFPIIEASAVGQVAILMLALWTISVTAYFRGNLVLSACALAFASTLKVTPILVIPLFLLWKEIKWLVSYVAAVAVVILGMAFLNGWHALAVALKVLGAMGSSMPTLHNKCITAFIGWLYYGKFFAETAVIPDPPHLLAIASKMVSIAFYAICLYLVWRGRARTDLAQRTLVFSLFAIVSVLCSPIAWRHAYTVAVVPLFLLWLEELRTPVASLRTALLALTTFAVGSLAFDLVAAVHLPAPLKILAGGVWIFSSIALVLYALAGLRKDRGPILSHTSTSV